MPDRELGEVAISSEEIITILIKNSLDVLELSQDNDRREVLYKRDRNFH
jgi:hypothetical protein